MQRILLKNILPAAAGRRPRADVLVADGRIAAIRPAGTLEAGADTRVLDGSGKAVVPAFVNMHTHAAMALMRGVHEDALLHDWLRGVWALEERVDEEFIYDATRVACLEMIKTGTATYNNQYWIPEAARKAALELGVRPVESYVFLDRFDPEAAARQQEDCERWWDTARTAGGLSAISVHAVYTVSEPTILWAKAFARRNHLPLHVHLSETDREVQDCKAAHGGLSPVEYLDALGVLDSETIAAHCLRLSDHDIEILGRRGVNCVYNVNSNAKLASGYTFRFHELTESGANVCLGTDGCASSNNLDMLEAMKTSALFQKAWREDPQALPLPLLMDAASAHGAKALGLDAGELREGALADLLVVDMDSSFFLSPAPFAANFVYSAHSDCIDTVLVGGRIVMEGRRVPGEKEILRRGAAALSKLSD